MSLFFWYSLVGALLVTMALADSFLRRLPLTTAMLYLGLGAALGPWGWGVVRLDAVDESALLELVTEVVVIISLFSAGLKLRTPLADRRWQVPLLLAFGSMTVTVGLIAAVGTFLLGLPVGAAVLLGAVLAPTDPVLASDVQVAEPADRDRLRFGLTGEAGLNDGTAFPFVMLGLGLLGLHGLGEGGWRWFAVDVAWAITGGLAIGALAGTAIGYLVIYLRREHREAIGLDDFLALGLIALSYGAALGAHTYGFLAVFAAGLALRRIERNAVQGKPPPEVAEMAASNEEEEVATAPETAPAYMAQAVLGFSEQLERIGTVGVVVLLGTMLPSVQFHFDALWFVPVLLLVIRPVAVAVGIVGADLTRLQKGLMSWFGIRGIGSIYYLMYAVEHGVPEPIAERLTGLVLAVVTTSVIVHGVTVTPLIGLYERRHRSRLDQPE